MSQWALMDRVSCVRPTQRGFDAPWPVAPFFALEETNDRTRGEAPLAENDVRSSFSAIAEMAGYTARLVSLELESAGERRNAIGIAAEIETAARALRRALEARDVEEAAS